MPTFGGPLGKASRRDTPSKSTCWTRCVTWSRWRAGLTAGQNGSVVDSLTRKIGFRRIELVQEPLDGQKGTSFYFKINNKPIFIGGSNWIPIDTVQSRGTDARFREWIEMLVSPPSGH